MKSLLVLASGFSLYSIANASTVQDVFVCNTTLAATHCFYSLEGLFEYNNAERPDPSTKQEGPKIVSGNSDDVCGVLLFDVEASENCRSCVLQKLDLAGCPVNQ